MLRVANDDAVTTLTLDRPGQRNALNWELNARLHDEISAAASDEACRVIVLKGAGGNFCAGRDLSGGMEPEALPKIMARDRAWADIFRTLNAAPKLSIAVVDGYAVAGGFTLAMGCDFVLSTRDARYGAAEMRNGFPAAVNTPILTHLLGPRLALELIMFGELVNAERLYQMGLINALADDEESLSRLADDWIGRSLALDQEAVTLTKEAHRAARSTPLSDALTAGAQQNALLNASGVFQAAAERFKAQKAKKK